MIGVQETANPFTSAEVLGSSIDPRDYHEQDAKRGSPAYVMTRSSLMAFRSCPAKWMAGWVPKDTDSTDWGDLQDCRVLTPGLFPRRFAEQPKTCKATKTMQCVKDGEAEVGDDVDWSPLTKECRQWKRDQEKAGLTVLNTALKGESDLALGILFSDERIKSLIKSSEKQVLVTGEYHDEKTGMEIPVKTLIDLVPHPNSAHGKELADFKTCRSAHPKTWLRAIDEHDYDAQAAMNLDLYCAATGEDRCNFIHAIQENSHPFQTARRMLSVEFIQLGRLKITNALEYYCRCLESGYWPDWDSESEFNGWSLCEPDQWHSMLRT